MPFCRRHFQMHFLEWKYILRLKFRWSLFPSAQLTIFQHQFSEWLGAGQATSHYLKQRWIFYWCTDAYICVTRPQWVNAMGSITEIYLCYTYMPVCLSPTSQAEMNNLSLADHYKIMFDTKHKKNNKDFNYLFHWHITSGEILLPWV